MRLCLDFHLPDSLPIDVSSLLPVTLLPMPDSDIERLAVPVAGQTAPLRDVCRVSRAAGGPDGLIFRGETQKCIFIGRGMSSGQLVVEGDSGYGAGMEMRGGVLTVQGSAEDCLGLGMEGGHIQVIGNARDWCGAGPLGQNKGMIGGLIQVGGSAGKYLGSGMRRGLIWVQQDAGDYCAERLLAGTIFCVGTLGRYAGLAMRRGSLVATGVTDLLPGFYDAGRADDEWLRIYFTELERTGIMVPADWKAHPPHCFTGDHLELGKGEILVYAWTE